MMGDGEHAAVKRSVHLWRSKVQMLKGEESCE